MTHRRRSVKRGGLRKERGDSASVRPSAHSSILASHGESTMRYTLHGAHLVDAVTDLPESDVTIDGARIGALARGTRRPGDIIDAAGMLVVPGLLDVHTHGGGGYNLHTTAPDEIQAYARWAAQTGVTSFLIGVVGTPGALPEAQLRAAASAIETWRDGDGAEPLGIHLEGPYIN